MRRILVALLFCASLSQAQLTYHSTLFGTGALVDSGLVHGNNSWSMLPSYAKLVSPTLSNVTINSNFSNQASGFWTYGGVTQTETGTELNYIAGVTSSIQNQLNAKQNAANLKDSLGLVSTHLKFATNNVYDIGGIVGNAPANIYAGTTILSLGQLGSVAATSVGTHLAISPSSVPVTPLTGVRIYVIAGTAGSDTLRVIDHFGHIKQIMP